MALDAKVSALTAALRSEFWKGWQESAPPAPWEQITTIVPSTTKIENYLQFGPVPGMSKWQGHRNYGKVDSFIYSIRNDTYQNGIQAALEDIDDDQTGGLMSKPKELVIRAKKFPGRAVLKQLALGTSTPGFDGTNFAAGSHTFGSGNNSLTFTSASGDGAALKLWALYFGDEVLKPLIWQNRAGPDFETNAGTPQSKESRMVRWWCDLRGAAAYGYWWNAVYVAITNTPNISEMHFIYQKIENAFRTFKMPLTISTEDGEYVHEQTEFNSGNFMMVGSTALAELLRQSLNQDWTPQAAVGASTSTGIGSSTTGTAAATTNLWKGYAKHIVTAFLN